MTVDKVKLRRNLKLDIFKNCIPIVVGALIAVIPTMIEKYSDRKNVKAEKQLKAKQDMYLELILLFTKVLKNQNVSTDLELLINRINLISITGSVEVVKVLNEYIDTWGKTDAKDQNIKYGELLKVIRVDLGIDKKINDGFPEIGLRDINFKIKK